MTARTTRYGPRGGNGEWWIRTLYSEFLFCHCPYLPFLSTGRLVLHIRIRDDLFRFTVIRSCTISTPTFSAPSHLAFLGFASFLRFLFLRESWGLIADATPLRRLKQRQSKGLAPEILHRIQLDSLNPGLPPRQNRTERERQQLGEGRLGRFLSVNTRGGIHGMHPIKDILLSNAKEGLGLLNP